MNILDKLIDLRIKAYLIQTIVNEKEVLRISEQTLLQKMVAELMQGLCFAIRLRGNTIEAIN